VACKADVIYSVSGLLLGSDFEIPGLVPSPSIDRRSDLQIWWGTVPREAEAGSEASVTYTSSFTDESGNPAIRIWTHQEGRFQRLEYSDGTQFWLDGKNENLWITWTAGSSFEDAATYLLGPVLGYILRRRGVVCLHASAVSVADRAAVFVGAEGAGKSTTAAALARAAHPLISDDVVALHERDGRFWVRPAYPYLSLWPDSVETLFGSAEALPRFSKRWEKRRFGLDMAELRFENRDLQLGAIYILGERFPEGEARLESISTPMALLSLVSNTYATNILDNQMRADEFEFLGRMVARVAVRKLHPPADASQLPEIANWIRSDLEKMEQAEPI